MTLQSAVRAGAPYVLDASGILLPAGMVDRDTAPGGGGGGAQQWALRHDGGDAGSGTEDIMIIADWASNPIDGNSAFTLEMWTRHQSLPTSNDGLIDLGTATGGSGTNLRSWGQSNQWFLTQWDFSNIYSDWYTEADDYNGTNWLHFALAYDPAIGSFGHHYVYRNGIQVGELDNAHAVNLGKGLIYILGSKSKTQRVDVDIFDVRIWSTVRTPTEILDNMGVTVSPSEPGLEANFRLNDGSEDAPEDATGSTTASLEQTLSRMSWVAITDPR